MKKTKKVISYIMLLVPFSLPAGCSPVSTAGVQGAADQKKTQADNEAEQLRLIVERYFEHQEQGTQAAPPQLAVQPQQQAQAAAPQKTAAAQDDAEPEPALVGSEEDLKEELDELKKTGDWKAEGMDGSKIQCQLPSSKTAVVDSPDRPAVPLVDAPLPQPAETLGTVKGKMEGNGASCFPTVLNRQVQFYLNLFQGKQRKNFTHWLERSSLYMPLISSELEKAKLPQELAYLAMIESGFNPVAYSPSQAGGLWQFIPSTARNFGLRVDDSVDERRDPEKSTKAAVNYLQALYKQFGDWHLSVAAYNAGEGALDRGLKRHNVRNFWDLAQEDYLRLETKRYVPQLIAAVLIARDPEQYGFSEIRGLQPVPYELVRVPSGTELKTVAASAAIGVEQLRSLNKDLLKDEVPSGKKGGWLLKVPAGRSALVAANLPKAVQVAAASGSDYTSHKVAKNETLQQISKKYGISMTALLKVNNVRAAALKAGQTLRIPVASGSSEQLALVKRSEQPALAAAEVQAPAEKVAHKLKKGETLSEVAEKYDVSLTALMQWNGISKAANVKAGQELVVHSQQKQETAQAAAETALQQEAATLPTADIVELTAINIKQKPSAAETWQHPVPEKKQAEAVTVLSAGSKKVKAGGKEAAVSYYKVRSGDSLWSISKKLQISAKEIKSWNSLGEKEALRPGLTLMIKNG